MKILVKTYNNEPQWMPRRANETDAGWDVFVRKIEEKYDDMIISTGDRVLIQTGVFLQMEPGWECQVRPRSGLALNEGITVLNAPGTIDAGYRGEVGIIISNLGFDSFQKRIKRGDKIAQLVFHRLPEVSLEQTTLESETQRGKGGYGSTGK